MRDIILAAPTLRELEAVTQTDGTNHSQVRLVVTGVGPGGTAHTVTRILSEAPPSIMILAGIAGAYPGSGLKQGEVCIAGSEMYGDLGRCTESGPEPVTLPGGENIPLKFDLICRWKDIIPDVFLDSHSISPADMVTVSCSSACSTRATQIRKFSGAAVENMEGAAAAQSCEHYDVPLVELRAISNTAGSVTGWDITTALSALADAVAALLKIITQRY